VKWATGSTGSTSTIRTKRGLRKTDRPNRWDLVVAADLIAYLKDASQKRAEIAALFSLRMAQLFDENASSPAQLREEFMRGRPVFTDVIFQRAAERGEVDLARLTPRLRGLAFDLLRAELMMTLRPVPEESIIEVDQIVLPLVRPGAG
jgi:Tetracyclin repressor-like, C-terminal domain